MVSNKRVLAAVLLLATLLAGLCLVGLAHVRMSLVRARDHCRAIPAGATRLDAERALASSEAASPACETWDPNAVFVGRTDALASWLCRISLDGSSTRVITTDFLWTFSPELQGDWYRDARSWIEMNAI